MNPKFTPGPWGVARVEGCSYGSLLVVAEGVGDVFHVFQNGDEPDGEAKANAALIAEAPMMFELLRRLCRCGSIPLDELPDTARQTRALLARVRGAA